MNISGADMTTVANIGTPPQTATEINEEIIFDEAVEALGEEGLGAIAGALDMFRKK